MLYADMLDGGRHDSAAQRSEVIRRKYVFGITREDGPSINFDKVCICCSKALFGTVAYTSHYSAMPIESRFASC